MRLVRRRRDRSHVRRRTLDRYLGSDEQTLLVTRQHPFALIGAATQSFGLLAPLLLAVWGVSGIELLRGGVGSWIIRVAFIVMLVILARLAWRVVGWELERVVVTDEKVIHVEGVLHRRISSTPLAKVSEFTVHQPLLGRMFDYGSLIVDVPGGREQALHGLAYLPDPAGLYRLVSDRARRGRVQEGGGRIGADARPTHVVVDAVHPAAMPARSRGPFGFPGPGATGEIDQDEVEERLVERTMVIPPVEPGS